jgi:hypothetical protein
VTSAFVTFETGQDANQVINELNSAKIGGGPARVIRADFETATSSARAGAASLSKTSTPQSKLPNCVKRSELFWGNCVPQDRLRREAGIARLRLRSIQAGRGRPSGDGRFEGRFH